MHKTITLDEREFATVIAALRLWQQDASHMGSAMEPSIWETFDNGPGLDDNEIDVFVNRIEQEPDGPPMRGQLFDALISAYGSLCDRADPTKRPAEPVDWPALDAAIHTASGGRCFSEVQAINWRRDHGHEDATPFTVGVSDDELEHAMQERRALGHVIVWLDPAELARTEDKGYDDMRHEAGALIPWLREHSGIVEGHMEWTARENLPDIARLRAYVPRHQQEGDAA